MSVLTERLGPFIADTTHYLNVAATEGRSILLEGAQATLLDVDHGTYPFVTSSNHRCGWRDHRHRSGAEPFEWRAGYRAHLHDARRRRTVSN